MNRRKSRFSFALAIPALLVVASCLTACAPTRKQISIQTTPPGATVKVDDEAVGQTPLVTTVVFPKKDGRLTIIIEKAGYKPVLKKQHKDDPGTLEYVLEPDSVTIEED